MPGISGLELRYRLAADGDAAPVLFVTSHDDPKVRNEAMADASAGQVGLFGRRLGFKAVALSLSFGLLCSAACGLPVRARLRRVLPPLILVPGHNPNHEQNCLTVAK